MLGRRKLGMAQTRVDLVCWDSSRSGRMCRRDIETAETCRFVAQMEKRIVEVWSDVGLFLDMIVLRRYVGSFLDMLVLRR